MSLERMSLETSISERGEKEVRDCVFVVMKLLLVCGVRNWSLMVLVLFVFLLSTIFFFFSHTTQHNIQNKTKQNKTADTYSTSQGSIKREGEREGQQEHKNYSFT